MDIRQDDPNAPHVATLLAFHLSELHAVMSGEFAFALDARGLSEPGVTFWTVWIDDALAGFSALKRLDADHAEVKSMRADPAFLGRGVGRAMMDHIVAAARADGYARLSLETGTAASHDAAVALYHRTGFVDCPPFADYRASPHNRFMTLAL